MSYANHIIPPQGKIGILYKELLINQKFAISLQQSLHNEFRNSGD